MWSHKAGFESEDSENEQTNFNRFERHFYEQRRRKHGNESVYLQQRKMLPFEHLLLDLGGAEIFDNLLAKNVSVSDDTDVFGWQDTEQPLDHRGEAFLTVSDEDLFSTRY